MSVFGYYGFLSANKDMLYIFNLNIFYAKMQQMRLVAWVSVQRSLRFLAGLRRIDREEESKRNGSEKGRIGRKEKKVDC